MLIKESTLRRIIREESRRLLREEVTTYTPEQIETRLNTIAAKVGVGPNPLSDYQKNWSEVQTAINGMSATFTKIAGYNVTSGAWAKIYSGGAADSRAVAVLSTINKLPPPPQTQPVSKLRAIFRSMSTGKAFTGASTGGFGLPDYDDDAAAVKMLNAAIMKTVTDMDALINSIESVVDFDLAREMLPAAAPAQMDWTSYVAKTNGGAGVKVAWEAYANSKGVKSDFMSFARWWQAYKKSNPRTFTGNVDETISALKLNTAPAAASAAPVRPGTAATR